MSVVFTVEASDEFDDIAAGIASGKAVPEIFGKADNKGVWVVAPVNGTRAEELIGPFFKRCHDPFSVKYRYDGDVALEIGKIEVVRDHLDIFRVCQAMRCQVGASLLMFFAPAPDHQAARGFRPVADC